MAKKKNQTSITPDSRKDMPSRGKAKKTLILDAIKERALLEMDSSASNEEVEKAVFGFMAEAAFNPTEDTGVIANNCLTHLMNKGWASIKPSSECVEYEFDENAKPHEQAAQIMRAISDGVIPPDIGSTLVNSIASMLKIAEVTELEDRIAALEDNNDG